VVTHQNGVDALPAKLLRGFQTVTAGNQLNNPIMDPDVDWVPDAGYPDRINELFQLRFVDRTPIFRHRHISNANPFDFD
jgi:hypothetical protein